MRDEHMLMYVLVFVLGFMVSRMMGDQLIEGDEEYRPPATRTAPWNIGTENANRPCPFRDNNIRYRTGEAFRCVDIRKKQDPYHHCNMAGGGKYEFNKDNDEKCCHPKLNNCDPYPELFSTTNAATQSRNFLTQCCKKKPPTFKCSDAINGECEQVDAPNEPGDFTTLEDCNKYGCKSPPTWSCNGAMDGKCIPVKGGKGNFPSKTECESSGSCISSYFHDDS